MAEVKTIYTLTVKRHLGRLSRAKVISREESLSYRVLGGGRQKNDNGTIKPDTKPYTMKELQDLFPIDLSKQDADGEGGASRQYQRIIIDGIKTQYGIKQNFPLNKRNEWIGNQTEKEIQFYLRLNWEDLKYFCPIFRYYLHGSDNCRGTNPNAMKRDAVIVQHCIGLCRTDDEGQKRVYNEYIAKHPEAIDNLRGVAYRLGIEFHEGNVGIIEDMVTGEQRAVIIDFGY